MTDSGASPWPDAVTFPYLEEYAGGPRRPYLWLEVTGPNGEGGPILGLVDTGADVSVLPLGYAQLMGYGTDDLTPLQIHGVGGQVDAYTPKEPFEARVAGLESITFEMRPAFMSGSDALWGRNDFMQVFGIVVEEREQRLSLILPRPGEEAD